MRWWPKPIRIVPITREPPLPGTTGIEPSRVPSFDVTRSPLTKGERVSASFTVSFEALREPTLSVLRKTHLARDMTDGFGSRT